MTTTQRHLLILFVLGVVLFFIGNEGLSILENASNCGLPVPKKLKDTLAQFIEIKAKK